MTSLDSNKLKFEELTLFQPSLTEISNVLSQGLKNNFNEVLVEVVTCPDLTKSPFHLANKGLGGKTSLIEIGGAPYLLPLVNKQKVYDIHEIVKKLALDPALVLGAGAGPWPYLGRNAEGIFNVNFNATTVNNNSHIASVGMSGDCILQKLPNDETRCALLANLFMSEGTTGKVLKVHCKVRFGKADFITSIRESLALHYGDNVVGLGGTFILKNGKAKQHVMPDFSKTPINSDAELNQWLNFYDMDAELIAVGTFVTHVTDLDLRVQHFHSFSTYGAGGHYHNDTTPEIVEYLGYFNIGEKVVRVDRPVETHLFGRD